FISFFYRHATPQNKHSFPTRRSSDLTAKRKKRWVFTSPSSVEILPRARVPKGFGTSAAIIFNSANSPANERRAIDGFGIYRRCFETSLVISNILTWLLPLNTGLSESSALIMVRFFLSWQPCFLK